MNSVTLIFSHLRNGGKHSTLPISPYELDPVSIVLIIIIFIIRTLGSGLGLGTPFARLKSQDDSTSQEQFYALPDISLAMPLVLDASCERIFSDAIHPTSQVKGHFDMNNAQICLYLASLSEPAMLMLLAKQGCPVRPLGAVNVRNRFELPEPALCRAVCGISNNISGSDSAKSLRMPSTLSVTAKFPRPARRVRRGIELDVEVSILADGARSGSAIAGLKPIFRQEFTMLQFMKFHDKLPVPIAKQDASTSTTRTDREVAVDVFMSAVRPYAWARLCKDYNPIHFSPFIAKILGQPGQLAHGNQAVGICIQAMSEIANKDGNSSSSGQKEPTQKEAIKALVSSTSESKINDSKTWSMDVRFRRPLVLPARFGPKIHTTGNGFDIVDKRSGKIGIEVDFSTV